MGRINEQMIAATCRLADDVYFKKIKLKKALNELEETHGMNKTSAWYYVNNFRYMMDGRKYQRSGNAKSTELFFQFIHKRHGRGRLENALNAARACVEHRANLLKDPEPCKRIRAVINKYQKIVDNAYKRAS